MAEASDNHPDLLLAETLAALNAGRLRAARCLILAVLDLAPELPEAWILRGMIDRKLGRTERAVDHYHRAISLAPDNADAHHNLGNALAHLGRDAEASGAYRDALALDPGRLAPRLGLATILGGAGCWRESLDLCREGLVSHPDSAELQRLTGDAILALGDPAAAVDAYRAAIRLNPDDLPAHCALGRALLDAGRAWEAADGYRMALERHPDAPELLEPLGVLYESLGEWDRAVDCWRRVLDSGRDRHVASVNLGNLYYHRKELASALAAYDMAIAGSTGAERAYAMTMAAYVRQKLCDWDGLRDWRRDVLLPALEWDGAGAPPSPFVFLTPPEPVAPEEQRRIAARWADFVQKEVDREFTHAPRDPERLRIGYVSADFYDHATLHLMGDLFGLHDRGRFEIYAYSAGRDDGSEYRRRAVADVDVFVDIREWTDAVAAQRIFDDRIDILVDLKGYTAGARPGIFARRPAPVQVAYLGYPGTMGADFMDYLIGDAVVTPPEHQPHYTEKLVILPHCYQVNERVQAVSDEPLSRSDCGLPDGAFVYCCFNTPSKIEPTAFAAWMDILRQVDSGVLWLYAEHRDIIPHLRQQAERHGVDPERLVFATPAMKPAHLARIRLADLFLDTRFYNAHTTASDALRIGLPLLTCPGDAFAARVAASLLTAMDLPELIAANWENYRTIAVDLARSPEKLSVLRRKIERNRSVSPLYDPALFTRHLELAFTMMWENWRRGEPPGLLRVPALEPPERGESAAAARMPVGTVPAAPKENVSVDSLVAEAFERFQAGDYAEASRLCRKALALDATRVDGWTLLGMIHRRRGELREALDCYRRAFEIDPGYADAYNNAGNVLADLGRGEEAKEYFECAAELRARSIQPDKAETPDPDEQMLHAALRAFQEGRSAEGLALCREVLSRAPERFEAWTLSGACLRAQGQFEQAVEAHRRALALNPEYIDAHTNLSNVLRELGRFAEAVEHYRFVQKRQPSRPDIYKNLGNAFYGLGNLDQAIRCFRRALALDPDYADAHWDLALALLAAGDYEAGWREHEWRWRQKPLRPRDYAEPQWQGQPLAGKRVLIYAEQGFGDSLQFLRFVPDIGALGAEILLELQPELRALAAESVAVSRLIDRGEPSPPFDYHLPMHSLPYALGIRLSDLPGPMPYLKVPEGRAKEMRVYIRERPVLKVGLVWAGSPTHGNDRWRSPGFETLAPLLAVDGAEFYLLQKGPGRRELEGFPLSARCTDLDSVLRDFADTAAAVAALDLVITPDTSVAHLAGALGRPCWVLLPALTEWRWMLQRSDNPWYPSLRLFRQTVLGEWGDVMVFVKRELVQLAERFDLPG
jgi:predicted O-linked N-acetylglucosamine transferase (SPINDLY family)